jgi:hypothetical protein
MAGGIVMAAAAAQARRRRVAEVVEAFRAAGATAPDRARGLDDVLTGHAGEVRQLAEAGVLVAAPAGGRWYLDEAALAAWEEAQRRRGRRYALTAIAAIPLVAGLLLLLALWIAASRHP